MTNPTPVEISDLSLAFPADALDYMPAWEDIPDSFKENTDESRLWRDLQRMWFSQGLSSKFGFVPIEGLDGATIFRQLSAIQGSYAPKHQHKQAAVAWLASLWMECVLYGPAGCDDSELTTIGEDFPLQDWLDSYDKKAP